MQLPGRALDLHDAAPLPRVIVDEAVGVQILAAQHAGGGGVLNDAALKRLQRGGSECRRERRIRKGFGRHAAGIVDVEQAVARGDAEERERQIPRAAPNIRPTYRMTGVDR